MLYKNERGRVIGSLRGNTFKKTVKRSTHLMRVNNSWGIQAEVLQELPDQTMIEIFDTEDKTSYLTTAKEFREGCTYLQFGEHGLQAFLSLDKFSNQ